MKIDLPCTLFSDARHKAQRQSCGRAMVNALAASTRRVGEILPLGYQLTEVTVLEDLGRAIVRVILYKAT